jgi:hypothetical protein
MNAISATLRELWGLFVDDGTLAFALVIWCAGAGVIFPYMSPSGEWSATLFFLGCLVILLADVAMTARRPR